MKQYGRGYESRGACTHSFALLFFNTFRTLQWKSQGVRFFLFTLLLLTILCSIISPFPIYTRASSMPAQQNGTIVSEDTASPGPSTDGSGEGMTPLTPNKGMISAGLYHTVLLSESGRVYCWGDNSYGQLGIGTTESEDSPTMVPDLVDIVMVSAGAYHTLALSADGNVYAWGRNSFGQIGNGTSLAVLKPVRIDAIPPMKEISAGAFHSLALSIDGKVFAWGNNNEFQVGDVLAENITDQAGNALGKRVLTPQVVVDSDAKAISAGGNHSLYLNTSGQVFAWGSNKSGQLGDGSQVSRGLPTLVYGLSSIIRICAGYSHNLALMEATPQNGTSTEPYQNLYVWGSDSDGQLGLGESFDVNRYVDRPTRLDVTNDSNAENDRIALIQAGYFNSMVTIPVIKNARRYDSVYVWGNNTYGQLGIGDLPSQNVPVPIVATSNGWTGSQFLPFQSIAIGGYHAAFLSVKGFVGTVGRANKGQLGNVSVIDCKTPVGVYVPDAIAPEWNRTDKTVGTIQGSSVMLEWPQAKDNVRVTGYGISYMGQDKTLKEITLGVESRYNIEDIDRTIPQLITVKALDAGGNKSLNPLAYSLDAAAVKTDSSIASTSDSSSMDEILISETTVDSFPGLSSESNSYPSDSLDESSVLPESTDTIPEPTAAVFDPLVWSPEIYGNITPLEVPWNVDYIYGAGVVLPPRDYSWIVTVFITIAIVVFFLFLGAVSFKRKHHGKRLFQGMFKDLRKKAKPVAQIESPPEEDESIVHIGDGIDLVDDDAETDVAADTVGKEENSDNRDSKNNKRKKNDETSKKNKNDETKNQ